MTDNLNSPTINQSIHMNLIKHEGLLISSILSWLKQHLERKIASYAFRPIHNRHHCVPYCWVSINTISMTGVSA